MLQRLILMMFTLALLVAQAGVLDDFNRPDAATLGPNWTMQNGGAQIIGNRAAGTANLALATYNGVNATSAFVDVFNIGTSLQYLALVVGYGDLDNNYFVKVQNQNGDNQFHNYAFYYGNNGVNGPFLTLDAPFSSGRIAASFVGSLATLTIDTNFDGVPEQTYSYMYAQAPAGSGIGLGFYGESQADNFGTGPGGPSVPEPSTLALVLAGLGSAGWLRRRLAR